MNWFQTLLFGNVIKQLETRIMATIEQLQEAIANEASEVKDRVDALELKVLELQEQVANGSAATPEQLDEVLAAVQNIFTPPSNEPV